MKIIDAASQLSGKLLTLWSRRGIPALQRATGNRGYTVHDIFVSRAGHASRYHVYSRSIRWDHPVGVIFYLDGDYWVPEQSRFHRPRGMVLLRLAAIANARNMLFIAVDTPDRRYSRSGFTWWKDPQKNGEWFGEFMVWILQRNSVDHRRVWLMGYSGGAEFAAGYLLDAVGGRLSTGERSRDRGIGGGAIFVAGGNVLRHRSVLDRRAPDRSTATSITLPVSWWVGDVDGSPDPNSSGWSAQRAAREGIAIYRANGWTNTQLTILPGVRHWQYNLPQILRTSLHHAGMTAEVTSQETAAEE